MARKEISVARIELCLRNFLPLHPVGKSLLCCADRDVGHSRSADIVLHYLCECVLVIEVKAILFVTAVRLVRIDSSGEKAVSVLLRGVLFPV